MTVDRAVRPKQQSSQEAKLLPKVGEGKRGENGHISYLIRQASAAMKQSFERVLRPMKLTHPQYVVLAIADAYQPLSGAELARITHLAPQTITVITSNLVRDKFLTRESDSTHAKVIRFSITAEGRRVLSQARFRLINVENSFTSELTPSQVSLVRCWLVSVANSAEEPANGKRGQAKES